MRVSCAIGSVAGAWTAALPQPAASHAEIERANNRFIGNASLDDETPYTVKGHFGTTFVDDYDD
jgi:hypothetical protein